MWFRAFLLVARVFACRDAGVGKKRLGIWGLSRQESKNISRFGFWACDGLIQSRPLSTHTFRDMVFLSSYL